MRSNRNPPSTIDRVIGARPARDNDAQKKRAAENRGAFSCATPPWRRRDVARLT
ncbi:hypothetical protein ACLMLE_12630 [Lysobacter capsici]